MTIRRILLMICPLICVSLSAHAQDGKDYSKVVNNHSVSILTIGAEYGYEQRLGGNWSLIGRAGIVTSSFEIGRSQGNFSANVSMAYGISIEPRYYTSLSRRVAAGKPTINNASDFIAIRMQGMSDGEYGSISLIPMYGIRRNGGKHWFHEFTFGAGISKTEREFDISPHLQYRLGFVF